MIHLHSAARASCNPANLPRLRRLSRRDTFAGLDGLYRDPRTALRQDVRRKLLELEPLEAALTPRARALLPDDAHANLARLRALCAPDPGDPTLDALSSLDAVLTERREALERAIEVTLAAGVSATEVHVPPGPQDPTPFLLEEPGQLRARDALRDLVRAVDAKGYLRRRGDSSYIARFTFGGAPFVATMTDRGSGRGSGAYLWQTWLGTVAPQGFRPLRVRPRHALDRVKAWLHVGDVVPLATAAADARYVAEGPARLVAALFDEGACAALLGLPAEVDVHAGPGTLSLAWVDAPLARAHLDLAARLARG